MTDYLNDDIPVSQPDANGCYRWMSIRAGKPSCFGSPDARPALTIIGDLNMNNRIIHDAPMGLGEPPVQQIYIPLSANDITVVEGSIANFYQPSTPTPPQYFSGTLIGGLYNFTMQIWADNFAVSPTGSLEFDVRIPTLPVGFATELFSAVTVQAFIDQGVSPTFPLPIHSICKLGQTSPTTTSNDVSIRISYPSANITTNNPTQPLLVYLFGHARTL